MDKVRVRVRVMVMDVSIISFERVTEGVVNDWTMGHLALGNFLRNLTDRVCRGGE